MIFAAPVVAAMAYGPLLALVVTKKGGDARKKAPTKEGTTEHPEGYDSNGLITTWKLASPEDTKLIKELVAEGMLVNMKPTDVKTHFPRFKRFANSCLSSKISNLKRDFRDAAERRAASMFAHASSLSALLSFLTSPPLTFLFCFNYSVFSGVCSWWRQRP